MEQNSRRLLIAYHIGRAWQLIFVGRMSKSAQCRTPDGKAEDVLSDPAFNARTRVHEYGGGEYVVGKAAIYFSNFK